MHFCYVLYNIDNNKTYVGYTINISRRLRQHNGEIKGGAKFTTRYVKTGIKWRFLFVITSQQFDNHKGLSFEWSLKYPTNKRPNPKEYSDKVGRIKSIPLVLNNPKFIDMKYTIYACDEYFENVSSLCLDNLEVHRLSDIENSI